MCVYLVVKKKEFVVRHNVYCIIRTFSSLCEIITNNNKSGRLGAERVFTRECSDSSSLSPSAAVARLGSPRRTPS